jgi:hypothetical protein
LFAWPPIKIKIFLTSSVTEPMKAHVLHCLLLGCLGWTFPFMTASAMRCWFEWELEVVCGRVLLKCANINGLCRGLPVICFCCGGHDVFDNVDNVEDGAIVLGNLKCPPARLRAFGSLS